MIRRRVGQEEGQVYPALLLAIIGGLAIAVAFVALQNLLDQTDRAASGADAAALAVGKAFKDDTMDSLGLLGHDAGLLGVISLIKGQGDFPGADAAAEQFAQANGAGLVGDVQYNGFDLSRLRWSFTVTTQQDDTVKGGGESVRAKSHATVAVDLTGLCHTANRSLGIVLGGRCRSGADWARDCVAPPPPTPSAQPSDEPTDEPQPPPPSFSPSGYCSTNLLSALTWDIHLIH